MFKQFGQLWKLFIRPPRQNYSTIDLGSPENQYGQFKMKRTDSYIINKKKQKIQYSLYEPLGIQKKYSCVIYCHCNSGSRLESTQIVPHLIKRGLALLTFDFTGSGLSDGEYVTLGKYESEDLECIINYVKTIEKIKNIALWGRSMGAVTNFLYLSKPNSMKKIKGVIFDSGFANLNTLALDIAKEKTSVPNILINAILSLIGDQIIQRFQIIQQVINQLL
ncbi:hypothetical protein IMG5_198760 [Ichthyophthirius multifiliis]|uniref:AB hydrolase-1 domain-containing protein n=1 Tax=Ichthyophthirius multifiliis TaxID=5932 RepID=G0R5G2_ICHMU|nr:hypothetical protein IMG5_198760 [Ichthyophthirius multifiliis]EGR27284.1 hypothetical protein IMG5_198760 [Ichthyophthirius multifiliis]|eukprot:XP_004024168.1 hypothetical protein IMG5_198760 [Ichthyophthirius multifiliis]